MKEKTLWVMCGVPGCGKSYVATRALMRGTGWKYVSRDEIRMKYLEDGDVYFQKEGEVYDEFIYRLREALKDGEVFNVVADATHLNWASRRKLLRHLGEEVNLNDLYIIPVVVYSSFNTCIKRNAEREGRACVPDKIIEKMYRAWRNPKTDPFKYDAIMEWDNETETETDSASAQV